MGCENSLRNAARSGDWLRREINAPPPRLKQKAQISDAESARLESVFNNIHDSVMILDEEKRSLLINPAMCRLLGLNPKTVVGKPLMDVVTHPDMIALMTRKNGTIRSNIAGEFPDGVVG
ncbi:MAG: PAS domain-containing protein [Anaerolineales bacterium]